MGLAENRPGGDRRDRRPSRASKSPRRIVRSAQIDFELDFYSKLLERDPFHLSVLRAYAQNLSMRGWYRLALPIDRRLTRLCPENPSVWYNFACTCSRLGRVDAAFQSLERALRLGYRRLRRLVSDPDLRGLRDDPRFQRLLRDVLRSSPRPADFED